MLAHQFGSGLPAALNHFSNREALVGVMDRGREQLRHRLLAKSLVEREPSIDGAGNSHGMDAALRHDGIAVFIFLDQVLALEKLDAQILWRESTSVESIEFVGFRVIVHNE